MSNLTNDKLKELMKIEPESMDKSEYESFVEEFKNAQLLLPVEICSHSEDNLINEPLSFKHTVIKENGCLCVPLFTDNDELNKSESPNSVIAIFTKDLKDMLEDSPEIDEIIINPASEHSVCIELDSFFDLFKVKKEDSTEWIFERAMPLREDVQVYHREEEPFMKNHAFNQIYSSDGPFKASINKNYNDHIPYLNILILPKNTKTVYLGGMMDPEMSCDILLAPGTEFKLVSQEDDYTMVWRCINQKYYDD